MSHESCHTVAAFAETEEGIPCDEKSGNKKKRKTSFA
jgi:hypothetical protein